MFRQIFQSISKGFKAVKLRAEKPTHAVSEKDREPEFSLTHGPFMCNPESVRGSVLTAFPNFKDVTVKIDYEK